MRVPRWFAAASAVGLAACSVVGIRGEEEPRYRVVGHADTVEIREYGPRIAAETTIPGGEEAARSTGFRRLAHYIFGGNRTGQSIAMTAPVATSRTIAMTAPVATSRNASGGWVMRFTMPASFTMQTLPVPDDDRVRLVEVPPETYAVLRFSGSIAPAAVDERKQSLLRIVSASRWTAAGEPVAWFYDPPWTVPFLRRNEVAVAVATP